MKAFYENEFKKTVETIKQLKTDGCLCFNLITDSHIFSFTEPEPSGHLYDFENIEALNGLGVKYVRTCREDYFNRDENVVALTSFPVSFHTTIEEMKHLADVAVENKYCLIYLMHSVFKKDDANYGNEWSYDYDKFAELVSYLKELEHDGKIDIMTTMDYVDMQMKK